MLPEMYGHIVYLHAAHKLRREGLCEAIHDAYWCYHRQLGLAFYQPHRDKPGVLEGAEPLCHPTMIVAERMRLKYPDGANWELRKLSLVLIPADLSGD